MPPIPTTGTPLFDGALEIVRKWGDVDRDALLEAAKALVALVVATSGVAGALAKQFQDRDGYISGTGLLHNVGCRADARYLASAAVVAVAAALQCHFDPSNCKEDAVRHSLTALFLSGQHRAVLPSVAKATALKPFVDLTLELNLDLTSEQAGLVGAAFGITAPLEYATKVREATVLKRALHIGHGILGLLLDDTIDVDGVRQDIVSGRDDDEGMVYELLKRSRRRTNHTPLLSTRSRSSMRCWSV